MLQFPYRSRPIRTQPPPSISAGTVYRHRPIIQVTLIGPTNLRHSTLAVLDTGSDECLFPISFLSFIASTPHPDTKHSVTWRGNTYPFLYSDIAVLLTDGVGTYRWPATVAFTPAPVRFCLLGIAGCLEYFDARFRGADRIVELEANWTYPGTK
jgi:hypothetical protein